MNKLFVFGDSYTQGHHNFENFPNYKKYKELRGGFLFDLWSEVLSKKLNYELENHGHSAISNEEIFDYVCQQINRVNKNDIVIINWTYITRFAWASKYGNFVTVHAALCEEISEKTRKEILINKMNSIWETKIYNYEKIIDTLSKSVGFDVYYWSVDNNLIYNRKDKKQKKYILSEYIQNGETLFHEIFRKGGMTISQETNGVVADTHLGETGHKVQGDLFYEYIMNLEISDSYHKNIEELKRDSGTGIHLHPDTDPTRINKNELFD